MNDEQAAIHGLTRTNTNYPAWPLYEGWFYTPAEIKNIERRASRRTRRIVDEKILKSKLRSVARNVTPASSHRSQTNASWEARRCKGCDTPMDGMRGSASGRGHYCSPRCNADAKIARRKARKLAKEMQL